MIKKLSRFTFMLLSFLAAISLNSHRFASAIETKGADPFFSNRTFNPAVTLSYLPNIALFNNWSQKPIGTSLAENLDPIDREWLGTIQAIDVDHPVDSQLAVLSPLIIAAERAGTLKTLTENISKLIAASNPKTQEELFKKIVGNFDAARDKAAPSVFSALKKIEKYYADLPPADASKDQELQAQISNLHRSLTSLARLYGKEDTNHQQVVNVTKTLDAIRFAHTSQILQKALKAGPDSAAAKEAEKLSLMDNREKVTWIQPAKQEPKTSVSKAKQNTLAPSAKPETEPIRLTKPSAATAENLSGQTIIVPTHAEIVKFGDLQSERVVFPNVPNGKGTDIPALLAAGNRSSNVTRIAMYEQGLDEDVDSIIEGLKKGDKYQLIIDYSQLFGKEPRTAQLQKLVDYYLSQNGRSTPKNLEIKVLKGLGSIGINHNKFRIWHLRTAIAGALTRLLQAGSYNYTPTAQNKHWENVGFVDDEPTINLYDQFFDWMWSVARDFEEGMSPEDPHITVPIITDTSLGNRYYSTPIPLASFSPNGGTQDWIIKIAELSTKEMLFVMFGFYPPQPLLQALTDFIQHDHQLRVLADYGQAHNSASIAAMEHLMSQGAQIKLISGPHETPWKGNLRHDIHEKLHHKLVFGDPALSSGIVLTQSTNVSKNAYGHNFENSLYRFGVYLSLLHEHAEALWQVGFTPDFSHLKAMTANSGDTGGPQ